MASLQVSAGSRAQQSATEEADSTTEAAATKRLRLMDEFEDEDSEWEGELLSSVMQYLSPTEKPAAEERSNPLIYWKNSKYVVGSTGTSLPDYQLVISSRGEHVLGNRDINERQTKLTDSAHND